jgi:putative ABC transport system permease protein
MHHDVRHALRTLLRNPGFTAVAVLTLALGIGANTAVFSVLDAVLLRPLPYPDAERIVRITEIPFRFTPNGMGLAPSIESHPVFSGVGLYASGGLNLGGDPAERVRAAAVSAGFFAALGVQPVLGRPFTAADVAGNPEVVVLGHRLWQRRFAGDTTIAGRSILLNGKPYLVTGVLPPRVDFPDASDLWIPAGSDSQITGQAFAPRVIARLAPGITPVHARAEIDRLNDERSGGDPERRGNAAETTALRGELVGRVRPTMLLIAAGVVLVLLVACINAANLLLARVAARAREFAVRRALGASRGRLMRLVICESLLMALLGGAAALPAALWTLGAVRALVPPTLHGITDVQLDARALAATLAISLLTAVLFGLAPSLSIRGRSTGGVLRATPAATADPFWRRFRSALVVAEVAIAIVLLSSAAAVISTVSRLMAVDLGARGDRAVTLELTLPFAQYGTAERIVQFYEALESRAGALPGIERVGATNLMPGSREVGIGRRIAIEGAPPFADPDDSAVSDLSASPGYFRALGIDVIAGRAFEPADRAGVPRVAIVNEHVARAAGATPDTLVGRQLTLAGRQPVTLTIVGVVRNVRLRGPESEPRGQVYRPYAQSPSFGTTYVAVKSAGDPLAAIPQLRAAVAAIDPDLPLYNIRTFDDIKAAYLAERRFAMTMMICFGILACTLASLGLYGVIAYLVQLRTREIGIRMALGASAGHVRWQVLRSGILHAAGGVAVGGLALVSVSDVLRAAIPGASGVDPAQAALLSSGAILVAALSTWIPARRATHVDPLLSLRAE